MAEITDSKGDSLLYSFPKLKGSSNYRTWKTNMQSCLDTNQVWEVCNGHHPEPHKPNPRRDMIKETFLLLPDKTEEDWKQYDVINKEYKIWAV